MPKTQTRNVGRMAATARDLARREWILNVQQRQRMLSETPGGIDIVDAINSAAFFRFYYAASRPLLIRGALASWPALTRWTPTYLAARVGPAMVQFQGERNSNPDFELHKDAHLAAVPFDRFIEAVAGVEFSNDAYITAYNSGANAQALAPLHADLLYLEEYLTRDHGMMWIGPRGTFTPLHFDLTNNLFAQIVGRKRFILLPPSETPRMANSRHVFSEVHDITDETRLARHPQARDAIRYKVELAPGDLLFIPIGWWHQVRALDFSVSMTYTNFRWPNDGYASFPGD